MAIHCCTSLCARYGCPNQGGWQPVQVIYTTLGTNTVTRPGCLDVDRSVLDLHVGRHRKAEPALFRHYADGRTVPIA